MLRESAYARRFTRAPPIFASPSTTYLPVISDSILRPLTLELKEYLKMSSPAQISANRANAQLSTGPRSAYGKAASSRNAFQFGVHSESMIIPGEDPAELDQLQEQYEIDLDPRGPIECALFQMIVRADWLLRRLTRIEAEVIRTRVAALEAPGENPLGEIYNDPATARILTSIDRRQQTLNREYFRALHQLLEFHTVRSQSDMHRAMFGQTTAKQQLTATPPAPAAAARPAPPLGVGGSEKRTHFPGVPAPAPARAAAAKPLDNPALRL